MTASSSRMNPAPSPAAASPSSTEERARSSSAQQFYSGPARPVALGFLHGKRSNKDDTSQPLVQQLQMGKQARAFLMTSSSYGTVDDGAVIVAQAIRRRHSEDTVQRGRAEDTAQRRRAEDRVRGASASRADQKPSKKASVEELGDELHKEFPDVVAKTKNTRQRLSLAEAQSLEREALIP